MSKTVYVATIPWGEHPPLTDEIAASAVGRPVTLGFGGDVIGTVTKANVERDPDRLCLLYELDEEREGSTSLEVGADAALRLGFIPRMRVS